MSPQPQSPGEPEALGWLSPGTTIAGRYRLVGLVGRGGMSRVYAAEDVRLGRRVALKFLDAVRFAGRDDAELARSRFFREARLVAGLDHPGIVSIHDVSEVEGVPFIVLKMVEGGSLRDRIRDGELPSMERALAVMAEVSEALEFAHRRGVLHRDLKPDNILFEPSGRSQIVDFGLAKAVAESSETVTGYVVGTPAYLAPERLDGQPATAASDVFSAGVVFYEYLTGQYPFTRSSLYYSIAFEEAMAPCGLRAEVPRPLEAVVLRMLAKRPSDRYPDFAEVGRDLARVETHLKSPRTPIERDDDFLAWRSSASRTELRLPFVGREPEMKRLDEGLSRAGSGRAVAFAVGGAAGVGKSRLVEELRHRARLRQMGTYGGRAVETGGQHPYQPFLGLLRNWAEQHDLKTAEEVSRHLDGSSPGLRGASRTLSGLLTLGTEAPRNREQLWEALSRFVRSLAEERPALVVLEDLHQADQASLDLLRYLLVESGEERLMVVSTYRPEGERASRFFAELAEQSLVESLSLENLSAAAIELLCHRLLGDGEGGGRLAPVLVRESQGNPLFVAEVLKLWKAEEVLAARGPGYVLVREPSLAVIPAGIRAVIERRLGRLGGGEREVAEVASVHGDAFTVDEVAPALSMPRVGLLRVLQELERRHHLIVTEQGRFRFGHDRVREVLYEGITPALRCEYHRLLAERLAVEATDAEAARVAHHYACAEVRGEASRWHRRAGDHARNTFALEAAVEHWRRSLELGDGSERKELLRDIGTASIDLGSLDQARERFEQLLEAADADGDGETAAKAWSGLAKIAERHGEGERLLECARRGLERIDVSRQPDLASDLLFHRARGVALLGNGAEAREQYRQALGVAREADDPVRSAQIAVLLVQAEIESGDLDRAEVLADEVERTARESGDRRAILQALWLRSYLDTASGQPERGVARLEQYLATEAGKLSRGDRVRLLINLASQFYSIGDFAASRRCGQEALTALAAGGGRRARATCHFLLLAVNTEMGDLQQALDALERLQPLAGSLPLIDLDGVAVERGCLQCELGRIAEGRRELEALARGASELTGAAWFRQGVLWLETGGGDAASAFDAVTGWKRIRAQPELLGRTHGLLARARIDAGDLAGAAEALARISDRDIGYLAVRRERDHAAASLARARGDMPGARERFLSALQTASRQGARIRQVELLLDLARLESAAGDPATAEGHTVAAVATVAAIARDLREPADRESFLSRPLLTPIQERLIAIFKGE